MNLDIASEEKHSDLFIENSELIRNDQSLVVLV